MKKILLFVLFLGVQFTFCYAQEIKTPSVEDYSTDQYNTTDAKSAEYPGGMMALRKDIADKINMNKVKWIKGTIVSKAKFTVNVKGKIENILVTGDNADFNKEIERAIKSLKTKWKPAESNGIVVRSYYSFPLTVNFE